MTTANDPERQHQAARVMSLRTMAALLDGFAHDHMTQATFDERRDWVALAQAHRRVAVLLTREAERLRRVHDLQHADPEVAVRDDHERSAPRPMIRNRKGRYVAECEYCCCPEGCACEGDCACGTKKDHTR